MHLELIARPILTRQAKATLSQELKIKAAKLMTPNQVIELVATMHMDMISNPRKVPKAEYNWWVDVYNFKRGKYILKEK